MLKLTSVKLLDNLYKKFKISNLDIESEIKISKSEYPKPILLNDYFHNLNDLIDEFNRLRLEVLSVCTVQYKSVLDALRAMDGDKPTRGESIINGEKN